MTGPLEGISGSTKLAAAIGDPVRHSLSPLIHNAGFAELGLDWVYLALPVAAGNGAAAIEAMRTFDISGLSVTMPHKDAVAAAVDRQSPAVESLGACNCVYWQSDQLVGDNTDGVGFVASLAAVDIAVSGQSVGVIGAGGAARAIVDAVGRAGASEIVVVNRSRERADVAAALSDVAVVGAEDDLERVDIVVNATSVGMGAPTNSTDPADLPVDPQRLEPHQTVVDIAYQPLVTPLMARSEARGLHTVGGLGMLIHQAAVAFEHWTGEAAPVDSMTKAVNRHLDKR